jgi:hypothetical protein
MRGAHIRTNPLFLPGGSFLYRNHFFNFRYFLLEQPLNTLLEGYLSTGSPAAGTFQANFNYSVFGDINKFNVSTISLKKGPDFIQRFQYFLFHWY